jgi:hypothetical protein
MNKRIAQKRQRRTRERWERCRKAYARQGGTFYPGICLSEASGGYTRAQAVESVGPGWAAIAGLAWDGVTASGCIVVQLKEKFGALRCYAHGPGPISDVPLCIGGSDDGRPVRGAETPFLTDFLASLELLSAKTCDRCGGAGRFRQSALRRTRCETCAAATAPCAPDPW